MPSKHRLIERPRLAVFAAVLSLTLVGGTQRLFAQLRYDVALDTAAHRAHVITHVSRLTSADSIFQFASTAPGNYQTHDIGRFVTDIGARDAGGNPIAVSKRDVNRYVIQRPADAAVVEYTIQDTWHTPVQEFDVYPMSGTDISPDHALINWHALLGFLPRLQRRPIQVQLAMPAGWTAISALPASNGRYAAKDYDHLIDAPVLLARHLSIDSTDVTGVPVRIAVYSAGERMSAPDLVHAMHDMLIAAGHFLKKLPVPSYTFLFDYSDTTRYHQRPGTFPMGAWEHATSSAYVGPSQPVTPEFAAAISSMAAHEFFHIVTPLNIHSEIIEHFDFSSPIPSRHLWLYEGVTEWAANKMLLEAGIQPLSAYLSAVVEKNRRDRTRYDTTLSLVRLAEISYTAEGGRQYTNIYQRGAVIAGLLDIELLAESNGRHGLRDLLLWLSERYGPSKPFPEDQLLHIIAAHTSPEFLRFYSRYIAGTDPPPIARYYELLGIDAVLGVDGLIEQLVMRDDPTPQQLRLRKAWLGKH